MICRKPFAVRGMLAGCGQCVPCRINRSRQWAWRQWFESLAHQENCFVTLTYAPGFEPNNAGHLPAMGWLDPEHLRLFLRELRRALAPVRIRFFAVGEYGDISSRPHLHLSLFGVSGNTLVPRPQGVVQFAPLVSEIWGKGIVQVAEFNEITAQYVCGYITKKWTVKDDPRLEGRPPEFARMSRRPGIGAPSIGAMAEQLGWLRDRSKPLPTTLLVGTRKVPLGRYLLQRVRLAAGLTEEQIRELKGEKASEISADLLALFSDRLKAEGSSSVRTLSTTYAEETIQKIRQVEARSKLFKSRRSI